MESISRETLIMKSYEDQSDAGDFKGSQVCRQTVSSIVESVSSLSNHAFDETGLFYQDSQSAPPLELIQPASDRPSKSLIQSVDHNIQQNDRNLTEIVIQGIPGVSVLASKIVTPNKPNCELLKAPNPIDVNDSLSLGSDINSRLHPPQIGTPKFKRGPGRPRKDSLGLGKAPRLPSAQKIKSLLGGVRGRKKADGSVNSVGGSNPVLSSSGDVSFQNESPPRGTEDTAESDSSSVASSLEKLQDEISMFPELWPGKVCGFCNLGERSMLGQGDLLRLEISEGFDPLLLSRSLTPKSQLERDNTVDKSQKPGSLFSRRQKGSGKMKRLVSQSSLESINEPVDEICGFVEEPEYVAIFDSISGLYYAHYNCALWCDGVEKRADGSFKNLEIEMLRSLHQRCQHCGNLGAGLMCRIESCSVLLHFPCAALSGAFQEPSSRTLVCSSHIESLQSLALEISGVCTVCDATGDVSSLIMCSSCGHHYHGTCMALNCDPGIRAGWQCPACKVCQACRQPGDESKLLACDTCDKTYHIFCLRPALSSIPKHSWKCKLCRMCTDCGARTPGSGPSSRWHANFSVCDSCYQQRNKGLACPLCGKAYRHVAQKLMLQCHLCKKYVHGSCDPAADLTTYQQRKELYPDYEYICIPCKAAGTGLNTLGGNPRVLSALKRSDRDETEDGINQIACATSQDSLFSLEDDSFPGTESSNDLIWLDKCLSTSLEDIKPQLPQLPPKDKNLTLERLQKRKLLPGRPKGVDKIATIPPHPNSARKTRFNEFAKKRGPKPKLRLFGTSRASINRNSTDVFNKGDEEPGVENRMVLCSARDEYVLQQDVCVMCGAFGNDLEGRLISCAQCGQCYHPYCVNVKVTKVVLLKGWRCLDCTVCEGCGQRNDESRLILCDECDVSFHIYCIDPPLEQVPQGTWKCKWCAVCQYCGSNEPGPNSCWHENYTKCGPCVSQNMCPVCNNEYSEDDLIIKCFNCERWLHSLCDMIKDEDDAETCAEDGYFCILCRPFDTLPPHLRPPPKLLPPKKESPPRSPDPALKNGSGSQFLIDGIYLSEYGVNQIKSLTLELPRKKRKKVPNIADMEAGILAAIESVVSGEDDKNQLKNSNSEGNSEKDKDAKKRQRNLQKLGIGGFLVRLRGPRYKDDESEAPSEQFTGGDGDKPKRKPARRKIKNKLMETFPTYLQEAFFGKGLMDPTKDSDLSSIGDVEADTITSLKVENIIKLSKEEITELELIKSRQRQVEEINSPVSTRSEKNSSRDASVKNATPSTGDALDLLPLPGDLLDQDLVNTIINDNGPEIKVEVTFPKDRPRASIDVSSQLQIDKFTTNSDEGVKQDDVLTDFLSSQFSLDAMESGLPSMDSKDVEDIFKNVLVEESQDNNMFSINSSSQPQQQQIARRPVLQSTPASVASAIMPSAITQPTPAQASPSIQRAAVVQPNLASPVSFPPPSPYHSEYSNSPQFSPAFSEPPSPWPTPAEDVDQPSSYNQRSILKWEADEGLGPNATISAVLYANINHPELKRDYTSWPERSKQIAKIWRGLSTDKRAPYLQKARENRAASRMQKAQQDQDKLLSVGVSQPKTPRVETQEERHWKQMQALRQQQQMSLQESPGKDVSMNQGLGGAPHPHLAFTSGTGKPGIIVPSRATSDNSGNPENVRQPLQVTTPHDQKLPPLHSPQIQSPPTNHHSGSSPLQPIRTSSVEMTPSITSPIYGPRGALLSSQVLRSPLYPRIPFTQSSKQQTPSLSENYGNLQPVTEDNSSNLPLRQQYNETDSLSNPESIYNRKPAAPMGHESGDSRPSSSPQGQETRQHLRDLLQRQQVKKQEQDQVSPTTPTTNIDVPQGSQRQMWPHEEWQKSQSTDASQISRQLSTGIPSTTHNAHANQQFRQPYLPPNPRLPAANTQATGQLPNRPGEFRMGVNKPQAPVVDIRARMMINQQRSLMSSNITNVIRQQHAMNSSNFNQPRNSLDPYGHLVQQRHGKGKGKGGHGKGKGSDRIESSSGGGHGKGKGKDRIIQTPPPPSPSSSSSSSSSMLAQQLGRPLQSSGKSPPDSLNTQTTSRHIQGNTINQSTASASLSSEAITSHLQPDHQELPDSVTAELEKLEQEQHSDHNADVEPGDLEDLGMDDDDLLGMGADFNILEYADPELDQAVGGEKTNILDNLDLEEEDKEEKEHKRKEDAERGSKKEDIEFSNAGKTVKQKMSPKTSEVDIHSNRDFSHGGDGVQPNLLRPQPPPPPYPGPPPPYPGRPQMGIRNGCGLGVNVQPVMAVGLGVKNSVAGFMGGERPPFQPLSSTALHSNSNPHLSLHQRRTLLLQEQPLLLEDLLEQEKREQLRQGSGLIGAAPDEPLLSDFDFERLKADVLSSSNLPVSLSPPNIVGQNSLPLTSQPSSMLIRNQPDWQLESEVNVNVRRPDGHNIVEPNMGIHRVPLPSNSAAGNPPLMNTARPPNFPLQSLPPPPNPPEHPSTEQERQMQIQYEQWLYGQQQVLSVHLKYFEGEVHKLRKSKKSLNSKLRQLRKNGNELTENDAAELERIAKDLPGLQKQLDQARKQSRQHNLLIQDYRNKQQKRQQMLGMSPGGQPSGPQGGLPNQSSPLGPAASSPLHSTPQSPMLSPSPSVGGPSPSPLMQHSPMASPLTPSPGPASNPMNQTSPRGNMNHGVHMMDDNSFSPNSDGSNRSLSSQNSVQANRMHHNMAQLRMGSTGIPNHQIMISQSGGMSVGNNPINSNLMMARGMNPNMVQMQHRPMLDSQCNVQRLRSVGQQDHMRNINPMGPRFQRIGMNQDMMMRARPPPNFSNPSQMVMSPSGQHYNVARVPFPSQSPTGSNMNAGNLRSPSPMTPIGGLGSPPNQIMMNQNRVSPASSPMRRPSGSGSMGSASPMAERPQSVENPLTPRNTGSRPHTPSSAGAMNCQNMDVSQLQQHMNVMENQHFNSIENCGMGNLGSPSSHLMQSFISTEYTNNMSSEYSPNMGGGGGGGGNPQILPFPSFSFFDGPVKLGLKGGNPFSVVSENATSNSNAVVEQNSNATIDPVLSVVSQQSVSSNPGEGTSACVVSTNVENLEASNSSSVVVVAATQVSEPVAHVIKVSTQQQQNEHSVTDLNSIESTSKQTSEENIISNHVTPSLLPKPEISSHENSSSSSSNAHNQNSIDLLKKSDDNIIDVASTKSFSTTGPVTLEENECNQAVVKSLQIEESTNTSANPNHLINDQPHQYNSSENLGNATHNIKSSVTYTVQQTGTTPIVSAVLHQIPVSTNSLNKTASIKQETIKNNTNAILKNDLVFQSKYNAVSQPMTISQCMTTNTTLQTTLLTSSIISQPFPVSSSFTDSRKVSNLSSNSEILSTTVSHAFPSTTALNTVQSNVILTPTTAVSTFANAVYHVSKQLVTTNKVPESVKFGQPMGLPNPPLPSTTLSVPPSSFVPLLKEPTQSTEQISDNDKLNSRVNSEQLVATTNQLQSTEHLKYASTTTTAVVISNIYTPFTQSNSSLNSNFLSNQDHSSSNKTALDNSIAIKTSQDNIVIQTSLPTPSDSDSLLPHSNKIENNSEQKIQYTNSFIASGHNLITSAQMTVPATSIMHTILAKSHVRPGSLPISHPVASTFVTAQSQIPISSTGESQNALLKQLLQNTGCASTAQTSENVGFSLTSCLQTRPTTSASVPLHTSHLSEAATRIPQPNPIVRPQRPTGPVQQQAPILPQTVQVSIPSAPLVNPIRMPIKTEILEQEFHPPTPVTEEEPRCPTPVEESTVFEPMAENNKEVEVIINEPKEIFEKEQVDKPILVLENSIPKFTDSKKQDEEAKKAKRRQYQSKRKQVAGKEATVSKKRPRKAGKPEEDYDAFIDNVMTQLRQLPPVGIVEPDLHHSFNNYSVFGGGDYNKLNTRGYSTRLGDLTGPYGHCTLKLTSDFYSSKPFGNKSPLPPPKTSPSHRGFYNQEFAAPKTVSIEKSHLENRTPTPIRESDTPDTIISSSSPECTNRESPDMFPGLRLVETDEDKLQHLRDSPLIEIAYPIPIRPLLAAKLAKAALDADKENNSTADISSAKMRTLGPFKENGNITVTLTLSTSAVDDIRGVLRNLANILSIEPPTYQIEKAFTPTDRKFFTYKAKDVKEAIDLQSILNGTAKFCKHCDVLVLNNIIKKRVTDLPGVKSENAESLEEFYFCSSNCYVQFSISHGGVVSTQEEIPTVVKHISDSRPDTKFLRQVQGKDKNGPIKKLSQIPLFKESDLAKGTNANLKKAVDKVGKEEGAKEKRKWHIIRYKQWTSSGVLTNKYKKPTEKEMTEMLFRLGITAMPSKIPEDTRKCVFCHQIGDGVSDGPGRLLNFDVDKWNHLNCALWSEEVYETENGALVNVENALKQSLALSCIICKQSGASVKCFKVRCTSFYHVGCAVKDGCAFYKNKSVYCPAHIPKGEKENELTSLSVFRRVYIQRDENRQVAVVMHHVDQQHLLRVGSLIFLNVGQLLPHQLQAFHTRNYIYPVGYKIVRFYWSMMKANKRCQYICSIHEVDGKPEFRITVQEEGFKEHVIKGDTAQLAWLQVLESVSKVRNAQDLIKVFPKYITGEDLFGLTEPAIVKVLESLPGIETLTDYNFKYGRNPLLELPLAINPSGCARSEPKLRTHFKKPHTQRTGASRASLPTAVLSSSEAACPYSKQFVHSKSSQYKKMKQEWRNNVYLARSKIQGLGLYAARDIEKHTMVIEYIGEIIRNELAELREKRYESQNRGIYMFRMDDERVIDATLCGGLARYINHSCNPNCVAETVEVDRDLRIIIFANRRISRGEELAYDYKFEVEDDQHKIPCLCGTHNCQQWMN